MNLNYIDPIAFNIFGLEVRWYAIWILTGILVGLKQATSEGKKLGIYTDFIFYGVIICVPLAILGARIWYVLFNISDFVVNGMLDISSILGLNGGLSGLGIQGGVMVAILFVIIYCKKTKVSTYKVFDVVAPGLLIGQIFGRWGNFCNHELYGQMVQNVTLFKNLLPSFITENMYISGGYLLPGLTEGYYHPVFLYESALNLLGLVVFLVLRRKSKKLQSGDALGFYLVWYGVVRTITESFRHEGEVLLLGNIRVSILISVIFIICGIAYLILKRFYGPKKYYLDILKETKENKIDTIIFDLDGTLLDTKELITRSFVHTFEHFFPGYAITDEELESFFGPPLKETFLRYETNLEKVDEMIEYYREFNETHHDALVKPFMGAVEMSKLLHKKGYNLGIVSSKSHALVEKGLTLCRMNQYFDVIVGADDVTKPKPDPEGILKVVACFPLAQNVLYIGDSPSDIVAGKNANVKTCAVMYSTKFKEVSEEEPNFFIHNLNGILKVLGE